MGEIEDMFPTELDDLPNEIISLILVKLCRHCSLGSATTPLAYSSTSTLREWTQPWPYSSERKALHALSLVSKRFRALAQPLLYHAAVIRYSGLSVDQAWPAHRDSFSNRVRPFLRTLTQRPDLAAAVQGVYLHVALVSPLNLGQCWQAVLEAEETGESFELPDLESELHDYPSGPALVLLITRLPSLAWIGYAGGLLFRSTPTATHTPGTFPGFRIERLELNGSSKEFHNLHHLIQKASPTMNTFCIDNCYPQSLEDLGPCPKLRNIYVTNCRPHGELHGRQFLTCSDRLETFTYDAVSMTSDAFPAEIYQLLEKNRETLKSIRLDLRYVRNILAYQFDEALFRRGMAKFDSYPVLEELFLNSLLVFSPNKQCKMPPSALTNILPRSIVTLHIADCEFHGTFESTGEGLVHLAEAKISALFPNLKQVLCECDAKGRLDEYGLEEKFAKAGVEFAYETWSQAASQRPSGRNRDTRVIDP